MTDIDTAVERAQRRALSEGRQEPAERAECAVCGKPLDQAKKPHRDQFCGSHDAADLRALLRAQESLLERGRVERYESDR